MPHGWPCWALSNHDVRRAVTRWRRCAAPDAGAAIAGAGVLAARFGLPVPGRGTGPGEADVAYERLQDPYGIAFWPSFKGPRRLPPHAVAVERRAQRRFQQRRAMAAGGQTASRARGLGAGIDPHSTLHAARGFLRWRKSQPALVHGAIRFLDAPEPVLAFVREHDGRRLLLAFNLSDAPVA